jgi:hypothetical protein
VSETSRGPFSLATIDATIDTLAHGPWVACRPVAVFATFFVFILTGFCTVIFLLAGDQSVHFSTFEKTMIVAFQMLGGEYPFLDSVDNHPTRTKYFMLAWFWLYLVVSVFIFLNVFITILGEAYESALEFTRLHKVKSRLSYHPLCLTPVLTHRMQQAVLAINQLLVYDHVRLHTDHAIRIPELLKLRVPKTPACPMTFNTWYFNHTNLKPPSTRKDRPCLRKVVLGSNPG